MYQRTVANRNKVAMWKTVMKEKIQSKLTIYRSLKDQKCRKV